MASQSSEAMRSRLAASEESESPQGNKSPLTGRRGESEAAASYQGECQAEILAEMEQNLSFMEMMYAPYLRHDVYGSMGRGDISIWEKAKLVLALLTFVPMKVGLLLMTSIAYYMVGKLCTMFRMAEQNCTEETLSILSSEAESETDDAAEKNSSVLTHGSRESYSRLSGVRGFIIVQLGRFLSRSILFVLGFYWIKVTRKDGEEHEALVKKEMVSKDIDVRPSAIVSNHISYIDILYHMSASFPSFVAKRSVAQIPLVGLISECLGCVYVEREEKASRIKGVAEIIKKRLEAAVYDKNVPLMVLFPEGTTTNGFYLLPFKTGAFIAGAPVQPVILKYPYRRFSPAWDTISGVRHFALMLCQFVNFLEVIWLPVYIPSKEEKSDPRLYASNVRRLMALEGGLFLSDIGLKEKRIYHSLLDEYFQLKGYAA